MSEPRNLPAVAERTVTESEYRRLKQEESEAAKLRHRVTDLERALLAAETHETLRGDAREEVLVALLPTLDDFERALVAARARQDHASILEGVELVRRELERVLGLFEVERIPVARGDAFDPTVHVALEEHDPSDPGLVVDREERAGYQRGKRVLRRAIVSLQEPSGE